MSRRITSLLSVHYSRVFSRAPPHFVGNSGLTGPCGSRNSALLRSYRPILFMEKRPGRWFPPSEWYLQVSSCGRKSVPARNASLWCLTDLSTGRSYTEGKKKQKKHAPLSAARKGTCKPATQRKSRTRKKNRTHCPGTIIPSTLSFRILEWLIRVASFIVQVR